MRIYKQFFYKTSNFHKQTQNNATKLLGNNIFNSLTKYLFINYKD